MPLRPALRTVNILQGRAKDNLDEGRLRIKLKGVQLCKDSQGVCSRGSTANGRDSVTLYATKRLNFFYSNEINGLLKRRVFPDPPSNALRKLRSRGVSLN